MPTVSVLAGVTRRKQHHPGAGADAGPARRARVRRAPCERELVCWRVAGLLVLLLAWETVARLGMVPDSVPSAWAVGQRLPDVLGDGATWTAILHTLQSAVVGLVLAVVISIPVGALIGSVAWLERSTRAVLEFLKPIPVVALLPLALLIFGVTEEMKVLLIAFGTTWPLLIQVVYGVRTVDPVAIATARSFRVAPWRRWLGVTLPAAAPYVATGLRVAGVSALLLGVVTELVGGAPGLGSSMRFAQNAARYPDLYAYVLITGLLGVLINLLLGMGERRVLRWHPSVRTSR